MEDENSLFTKNKNLKKKNLKKIVSKLLQNTTSILSTVAKRTM